MDLAIRAQHSEQRYADGPAGALYLAGLCELQASETAAARHCAAAVMAAPLLQPLRADAGAQLVLVRPH